MTHFPDLSRKVHVPRALHIKFPLGRTFGEAGREDLQTQIVSDMLNEIVNDSDKNNIETLSYRWKRD
ncbi:hypothetical protein CR194_10460 [Salipaludibacillus keqinensis]|uniref:Uncharacterized protein n=3 Tax=Salipaludibacillus keqinensis TaxID=2045207 RepID=A0A323TJ18_9BACI|nr:hypothetical protein [Salipaludibacillus keqinensis]PYZ93577.1 hypothetical protein CR194_10460 [Salipaludibacillus keqinensis]